MSTMSRFLNRDSVEIGDVDSSSRTLSGLAMPWDRVAMVRDLIGGRPGPSYPEAFAPNSTDVTLAQHESFPGFVGHDPSTEPIGIVKFSRANEGLMFDWALSKTPRANTYLELANDGAMRSVSVQFRPIKEIPRDFANAPKNPVCYRTEVGLRHLALAPTGYGQYPDAQVHSIRAMLADPSVVAAIEAADAAVDAAMKCLNPSDDDFNVAQAMALLQAADIATDAALTALNAPDPDDTDGEDADAEMDESSVAALEQLSSQRAAMWDLHVRRTTVRRRSLVLPDEYRFDLSRADFKGTGGLKPLVGGNPNDVRFPIKDEASLHDAMEALGRVKPGDRAEVIAHIKSQAEALHLTNTDTWKNRNMDIYG